MSESFKAQVTTDAPRYDFFEKMKVVEAHPEISVDLSFFTVDRPQPVLTCRLVTTGDYAADKEFVPRPFSIVEHTSRTRTSNHIPMLDIIDPKDIDDQLEKTLMAGQGAAILKTLRTFQQQSETLHPFDREQFDKVLALGAPNCDWIRVRSYLTLSAQMSKEDLKYATRAIITRASDAIWAHSQNMIFACLRTMMVNSKLSPEMAALEILSTK